ncbi:CDP-glycerol glycerophosphotransferase family protein [Ornithinibacillus contaminans]|uniref:CDP-glycerol glycerophosphotransferase family protein n=1 Tax=Ornithinibacillus contaminans TaxID=694055 RepID=UPI00064E122C|nr:CDP-glycerol glycerophosphotransferase family protein [Ornithinibacillus contaminans]
MVRELIIFIYLLLFKIAFNFFKVFPLQIKTVCVASFGDNIDYTTAALKTLSDEEIIVLQEPSCHYPFNTNTSQVIPFTIGKPFSFLKSIYHLATATTILVDNYFAFLSVTKFREDSTCIQLWHAAGAIKKFGLQQPSTNDRGSISRKRFVKVYNRFDYTIVGSETMAAIFQKSFGLPDSRIKRTGIPRSDFFFKSTETDNVLKKLLHRYPIIKQKKVILYAPTFRLQELNEFQLAIDIEQLYNSLSTDYVLFLKLHPAVTSNLTILYKNFLYDVSDYYDINHLLLCTDLLITDYSSIPFEFSLLERPMIFYAYDKEAYEGENGLISNYQNRMPGQVVSTTEEIIEIIKSNNYETDRIRAFSEEWNLYSKGHSSLNVARLIIDSRSVDTA